MQSSETESKDFISIQPGSSDGGGRHPRGLKGRQIGLWYAQQNKQNRPKPPPGLEGKELRVWLKNQKLELKKKRREERDREPCIPLALDRDKEIAIRKLVDSIKTPLRVPIQTLIPERQIYKKKARDLYPPPDETRPLTKEASIALIKKEEEEQEQEKINPINVSDKYKHMEESHFKKIFLRSITGSMTENVDNALQIKSKLSRRSEIDRELQEEMRKKQLSRDYQKMQEFRRKLPSWGKREELLELLENNQVIVISGETGCGKTTQVAQFILDREIEKGCGSACHVVCTQPRRISAISVAERVAAERDERVGRASVGYVIRLEAEAPRPRGSIKFCTTGVLLRMLEMDPALTEVSHLILDEIHERDTVSDFAITILKDIIPKRPDLRLILMSATLNAQDFSKYYNNCAMINIPGFTFPVKEYYLEDVLEMTRYIPRTNSFQNQKRNPKWRMKGKEKREMNEFTGMVHPYLRELESSRKYSREVINFLYEPDSENISLELIVELIKYICQNEGEGAILVFLPGWDKISTLNKLLRDEGMAERTGCLVIPLHSMLSTVSQRSVFDRPPQGVRKIVIATNIAETSITIDDVVFVIDCGKIKMKNFDVDENLSTLKEEWVSLANARQRRGRAGRVQDGVCYHLFTRPRENLLEQYPVPEMLRTRLEEVILQAKVLQLGKIKPFLSRVMNPPDPKAIDLSLKLLQDLNALDQDECLTPLGYHLAKLPMDPQTGKMILMGALFRVIDPIFSVAASLSFKDAFTVPLEREADFFRKKKELSFGSKSDHLVLAEALTRWEAESESGGGYRFAREYYLSTSTLKLLTDMKGQFGKHLHEMKFLSTLDVKDEESNQNSSNIGLVKAIICAGLYPNVAIIRSTKKGKKTGRVVQKICTPEDGKVAIHIRSINYGEGDFEGRFLVYHMKMKTNGVNLFDTSMVFALPLIFFGHNFELFTENGNVVIELSPKIRFTCPASTALLVKELRQRLDQLLEYKVAHPGITDWDERTDEGKLLKAIAELISHEDEKLTVVDDSDDEDDDEEEYMEEDEEMYYKRGAQRDFKGHSRSNRFDQDNRAHYRGSNNFHRNQHSRNYQGGSSGSGYQGGSSRSEHRGGSFGRGNRGSRFSRGVVPFPRF